MRISITSKIILMALLTGLGSLAVGGVIGFRSGVEALTEAVESKLTAQREIKRLWLESYINDQIRFTEAVGRSPTTLDAARELTAAFRDMHAEVTADPEAMARDKTKLESWYETKFFPMVDEIAGGHGPVEGIMPTDPVARKLQADYLGDVTRAESPPKKTQLAPPPGATRYDIAHARYNQALSQFAETIGFRNVSLIDAVTGDVVYAAIKEVDFASNMYNGPFAKSGFATAALQSMDPTNGGRAVIEDISLYPPAGFQPQMFTAVPVFVDGRTVAVLVAQLNLKRLQALLSDGGDWKRTGQGETGDVELIGDDHFYRSQAREMAANPDRYLAQLLSAGVPRTMVDKIRSVETTVLALTTFSDQVDRALHNHTGVGRFIDRRGVDVVASYGPIEVHGLRWVMQAKQDAAEAFAPRDALVRALMVAAALSAIVLTFAALIFATMFIRPLRRVVTGMRSIVAGEAAAQVEVGGNDEFAELGRGFNAMTAAANERDRLVAEQEAKVESLLREMYPAGLAERIRCGADVNSETVTNTSVIVTWIDGLDALVSGKDAAGRHAILEAVLGAINSAADAHQIESVGSMGEIHVAVCGLSAPRLDHAANALAWARTAARAVERLNPEWSKSISLRVGIESGEIDLLLLSRGHAAYEIWGRPLRVARHIVMQAAPGSVVVAENAFAVLGDVTGFLPNDPMIHPVLGPLRTWSRPATFSGEPDRPVSGAAAAAAAA